MTPVLAASADATVFAAFAVGFVSFISPCVLPLVPAIGFAAAIVLLAGAAFRWRRGRTSMRAATANAAPAPATDSARLDADLDRYDL